MDVEYYYSKYIALLAENDIDAADIDYRIVEKHVLMLKQFAFVENSSMMVFDIHKKQYTFMQSRFLAELGYELDEVMLQGPRIFYAKMHPDDISFVVDTHYQTFAFFLQQQAVDKKNFKCIYEFRLLNKDGKYLRFVQQLIPLELDAKGNIWLMLLVNDLLPGKEHDSVHRRKLINVLTGESIPFADETAGESVQTLSKREIEILGMLAQGKPSKQIAGELFISVNTVNNHRRNILEKTDAGNTAEAVSYAKALGLI